MNDATHVRQMGGEATFLTGIQAHYYDAWQQACEELAALPVRKMNTEEAKQLRRMRDRAFDDFCATT